MSSVVPQMESEDGGVYAPLPLPYLVKVERPFPIEPRLK